MRNIVKQNKQFLLAFFGVLFIMLSCSIFVSNSNMDPGTVTIQSITPVYDEEGTYSVGNTGVIFNDKEQVVKYNVVVQNNENYDVKVTDLKLGTKSQEFLKYEVENVELDEVIKPGETKELVISFETVKMDGWGRNFNDELVTTLVFDRVLINPEPSIPNNNQNNEVPKVETVPDNSGNVVVQPEVNEPVVNEPADEQPKEEVNNDVVTTPEEDANHELGMEQDIIVKDSNTGDLFVIFCFGAAVGVLGIGLVMVNKNKFTKYIVLFIVVGSSVRLASANEVFSLEIPINVIYESQNVMKKAYVSIDEYDDPVFTDFWNYRENIQTIYIENELNEFEEYLYKFDVSEKQNGRVIAYLVENSTEICEIPEGPVNNCYDLYLQADGILYPNEDMSYYFYNMIFFSGINNLEGFDTSEVTNMSYTFSSAAYFDDSDLKIFDIGNLDTSSVTNMSYMFYKFAEDNRIFELLKTDGFDTSNVTDMSYMFCRFASYNDMAQLVIGNLNTSKVTNMRKMFYDAGKASRNFTLDVSNFDTSNVIDMSYMFYGTGYYSENFTLDVSDFDTSNVTDMSSMFSDAGHYSTVFTLDVSGFDTRNVTDMSNMFVYTGYNNPNFTLDVSSFDTSNVTNMRYMFAYAGHSNPNFTLDLSNFDTSNVTNMNDMFSETGYSNPNFTLDLSNFDTSNVTGMSYMFYKTGYNSSNFTLDLSNFDTSNVTDMNHMFSKTGYNSSNFTLDLSNFDTSNVTNMSEMFSETGYNSSNFALDLSKFDTSNVTNMSEMFSKTGYNSSNFTLDVSNFDTSKVTDMGYMFYGIGSNSDNLNIVINFTMQPIKYSYQYSSVFTNTALKPGSKITVNYTEENSDFVDILIRSKTNGANIVKGKLIRDVISFTIEDVLYKAYEGMTWEEWVDSEFNTDGYIIRGGLISTEDLHVLDLSIDSGVSKNVQIIANNNYGIGDLPPA